MAPSTTSDGANGTNGNSTHTIPLIINGKSAITDTTFSVNSPASSKHLWDCSSASKEDALGAAGAAQAAFPAWAKTKPAARRGIFIKAADILDRRSEELAGYMKEETGSTDAFAGFIIGLATECLRDVAGRIATVVGEVPICGDEGTSAIVYKEPYGVVFAMAPW